MAEVLSALSPQPKPQRRAFAAAVVGVGACIIAAGLAGLAWSDEAPPPCANDISSEKAQGLIRKLLLRRGFLPTQIADLTVVGWSRDEAESWPTYGVGFTVALQGTKRTMTAIGNGCGLSELVDLTQGSGPIL